MPHHRRPGTPLISSDVQASYVFPSYLKGNTHSIKPNVDKPLHLTVVGALEGCKEGTDEGSFVGSLDGTNEGSFVGSLDGDPEGIPVGTNEGSFVGRLDGALEGTTVGTNEGCDEGPDDGDNVC